jgi:hypothetical protein
MSNSISFQLGRLIGGLSNWWRIFLVSLIFILFYIACSEDSNQQSAKVKINNETPAVVAEKEKKLCEDTIVEKKKLYAELTSKKQHWAAANTVRSCAQRLDSSELRALVKDAEIASHLSEINNPQTPPLTRAQAMKQLARDYPEVGGKYAAQIEKIFAEAEKKERELEKKRRRSEGVSIGMSKDDVLASSWGKPERINTTTTANTTREQWVYGGRNYLYFENNKLVTIQN